jgi:WD40 repeat protein
VAEEAGRLAKEGRLDRAARLLGDPASCAHPPADVIALLGEARAQLVKAGDPDALIQAALEARAGSDEVTAQRLLASALASAEASGARAEVVPWLRTQVDPLHMRAISTFAPGGRFVWLGEQAEANLDPRRATILDVETLRGIRLDVHDGAAWSPDGRYVALWRTPLEPGRSDSEAWVIALDTGATAVPRHRTSFQDLFTPDGRFIRVTRDHGEHVVSFTALDGKRAVETLRAPARGDGTLGRLVFAANAVVVGIDRADGVLVWRAGKLVATTTGGDDLQLHDDRLVFVANKRMAFIDLATPTHPVTLPDSRGPCGDAIVEYNSKPARCSKDLFVTQADDHACVWDLAKRQLVRDIQDPALLDTMPILRCEKDLVEIARNQDGATVNVYSATTGARTGSHELAAATDDGVIERSASGEALVARAGLRVIPTSGKEVVLVVAVGPRDRARTSLWNARTGKLLWRSPHAPQAHVVAFDKSTGDLVVASSEGALWRIDLASHKLRTAPPIPQCETELLSAHGSHSTLVCTARVPAADIITSKLHRSGQPPQDLGQATVALAGGTVAIHQDGQYELSVIPEQAARWSVTTLENQYVTFAVSDDGERVATAEGDSLVLRDRGRVVWKVDEKQIGISTRITIAADLVAICHGENLYVYGARGKKLFESGSTAGRCFAAFDPAGGRLAYHGFANTPRIEVRDLAKRTAVTLNGIELATEIRSFAWSPDGKRLAAVAGDTVYLWDLAKGATPTRLYVASNAAVSISTTSDVQLFGDAEVARGLLSCRIGNRLYPYALCRDRFEP